MVADTPGFSSLELTCYKEELKDYFPFFKIKDFLRKSGHIVLIKEDLPTPVCPINAIVLFFIKE